MGSKTKRGKARKAGAKVSHYKLSNKRLTKLAKQGKLKKNLKKNKQLIEQKLKQLKGGKNAEIIHQYSDLEEEDRMDTDDVEIFSNPNCSFVEGIAKGVKRQPYSDPVAQYEQVPRRMHHEEEPVLKPLLPIKSKQGLVVRMGVQEEDEKSKEDTVINEDAAEKIPEPCEPLPALSTAQLFAQRQEKLREVKQKIALLAGAIIENPEENMRKLKELRVMLEFQDPQLFITVRKLAMLSLLEVFKDIIPGYRIRPPTDKEKEQSMKLETKKIRDFEESLIHNYKLYLQFLERMSTGVNAKPTKKKAKYIKERNAFPQEAAKVLRELSVHCMCDLLVTHQNFNFRSNLVTVVVPFMNHKNVKLSDHVCECVEKIFKSDKLGEITLEIVQHINRMVKSKGEHVQPKVLETCLSLKIKESDIINKEEEKEDKKMTKKQKMQTMSRKERKRNKQMEVLEKELQEAQATVDKKKRARTFTDIVQTLFLVYFRILKTARNSVLLSSVLEGLAKYAHLINVEFFSDLFNVLNALVESEELGRRESLLCIQTAFTILSGQGSALNIDPLNFYRHLYKTLLSINAAQTNAHIPIVLQCLDSMMIKRKKQVSVPRALAFIKRLSTLTLQLLHPEALGLLSTLRQLVHSFPKSDLLFDAETLGSGTFFPELADPEHCNAHATALYELHTLRRHYHPVVRKYGNHICHGAPSSGNGQLPLEMTKLSPEELYNAYDAGLMKFIPDLPKEAPKTKRVQVPYDEFVQDSITQDASSLLENSSLGNISMTTDFYSGNKKRTKKQQLKCSKKIR
ncbi:nucleolar complex protein 3 homolog [Lingula anatina]|uniref:Nucleolar complex protein 3 homolog n=1 Tax=Lingula anatina TaxID=7574 RepID=A0A1S3KDG0_LINAN|nr:nucleolar complex protein 3 homolog [Lingula anatina]|eukprot:XP_013420494.1 nucleolar complex protein 3 homolog [Lingula anatina]